MVSDIFSNNWLFSNMANALNTAMKRKSNNGGSLYLKKDNVSKSLIYFHNYTKAKVI